MSEIINDRSEASAEFDSAQIGRPLPDGLPLADYMGALRQQSQGDFDRHRQEYLAQQESGD